MNGLILLRCICDETRFRILEVLQEEKEMCVSDLVSELKRDQPLVSHHLRALKQCGIVRVRENGKMAMYSIANKDISRLINDITAASKKMVKICEDPSCCA
jgi:DNA-binding transcriptional ArsR family regulator